MNKSTRWFVIALLSVSAALAIAWWWYTTAANSLEGFYSISDSFVDSSGMEIASVSFIRVEVYDSAKIVRTAELLTREAVEGGKVDIRRRRTFLYHFFADGDTAALTEDMVDELAYTHPSLTNASDMLHVVPNGWVVKSTFVENYWQPQSVEIKHSLFYKPKAGVRASDLR